MIEFYLFFKFHPVEHPKRGLKLFFFQEGFLKFLKKSIMWFGTIKKISRTAYHNSNLKKDLNSALEKKLEKC